MSTLGPTLPPNAVAADVAAKLNLARRHRSWRGTCPACEYQRAFSVRAGRADRPLLYCANGCGQHELAEAVARATNMDCRTPERSSVADEQQTQRRQEAALRLWRGSGQATGTLVADYLQHRALPDLERSGSLRFRPDCPHPEGGSWPAMMALVQDAEDRELGIHRTYLARDGRGKAPVDPSKASLGPIWGGAVRLDPASPEIVIGEGIESAASAGRILSLPAWAALSAGNLAKGLVLPPEVRSVVIAADADPRTKQGRRPGQDAARSAAHRWRSEGRRVRIAVPDGEGADFNDVLRSRANG